ncbi:hypothetical protein A9Q84_16820 [Halobacteriovorax marinus]|uniref:Lipoprotein n=1 Tax=Halobacteriovorax marinus TaxID=97084 RepID=A0A1Y5F514_9BACT|nr:hypothetical protein A9Q84_16820 [Halobacteriovorax marinus]
MPKYCILIILSFFLTSCATSKKASPKQLSETLNFTPRPGYASVNVYRPSRYTGSAANTEIIINGKLLS